MYYTNIFLYSLLILFSAPLLWLLHFFPFLKADGAFRTVKKIPGGLCISAFVPVPELTPPGKLCFKTKCYFLLVFPIRSWWPLCGPFLLVYIGQSPSLSGWHVTFGKIYYAWFFHYGLCPPAVPWSPFGAVLWTIGLRLHVQTFNLHFTGSTGQCSFSTLNRSFRDLSWFAYCFPISCIPFGLFLVTTCTISHRLCATLHLSILKYKNLL